ncbi:hypothetical protein SDC9_163314 [bioreactor metagenome]|uniref:Uncharacterized protein n=1 Tax=bioreactor metagenome TaxID=1076179 RepID=A0A645FNG9_9ZZZZ
MLIGHFKERGARYKIDVLVVLVLVFIPYLSAIFLSGLVINLYRDILSFFIKYITCAVKDKCRMT